MQPCFVCNNELLIFTPHDPFRCRMNFGQTNSRFRKRTGRVNYKLGVQNGTPIRPHLKIVQVRFCRKCRMFNTFPPGIRPSKVCELLASYTTNRSTERGTTMPFTPYGSRLHLNTTKRAPIQKIATHCRAIRVHFILKSNIRVDCTVGTRQC